MASTPSIAAEAAAAYYKDKKRRIKDNRTKW